jgi:hypothetical protein
MPTHAEREQERQLAGRLELLEQELRHAQARMLAAEQRADLAERSARDAWVFVKMLRGTGRRAQA